MSQIEPIRDTGPRLMDTIFGVVEVHGPFAEDYTRLGWRFKDHWSGESALYCVASLEAYVQDQDGDDSYWRLKDLRTGKIIAEGGDAGFDPPHFFACLAQAEAALRAEAQRRKRAISGNPGEGGAT